MKRKLLLVILVILLIILLILAYKKKDEKNINLDFVKKNDIIFSNNGEYYNPEYNHEYINNINEIVISSEEIKNKYQFVYISDLQASVKDENEENEQIRTSLEERYNFFVSLNPNNIGQEEIFNEVIDYSNKKNIDALLLGGDIIDSPSNSNFNLLRRNLNEKLNVKYLYTLGNHDWSFAWDYHTQKTQDTFYPMFKDFMNDINVSYLEFEDLIILAINDGKEQIEKESIKKIENVLKKQKPTIVMLHVPISTNYIVDESIRLRNRISSIGGEGIVPNENTKEAIDLILSDKYKVLYVLAGHIHFELKDNLNENIIEYITAPAYAGEINLIKINK